MLKYEEISDRLAKGCSFQDEMLKLICHVACSIDEILFINRELAIARLQANSNIEEVKEPEIKKRGRPLKKGWNNAL